MSSRLSKLLVFTFVGLLAIAPLALAQQTDRPGTGTTGQPSERPYGAQPMSPSVTSPRTGTMDMQNAINATVADVNKQQKTVKLRMQNGETVELKVPDRLLTDLNQGDSVQVSIHKAEGQHGMGGTQPTRPGQTR